jgi:hypothetical protein
MRLQFGRPPGRAASFSGDTGRWDSNREIAKGAKVLIDLNSKESLRAWRLRVSEFKFQIRNSSGLRIVTVILIFSQFFAVATGAAALQAGSEKPDQVSALDYGAIPDDGKNDIEALRTMLDELRGRRNLTIVLPPGRYDLRDEDAVALMDSVMRGELGNNPQSEMFRPYRPYVRGLDFSQFADLTVEAAGAELICDGWMEPVSLDRCERIAIHGLTIDYKRPPYSVGTVVNIEEGFFDVKFGPRYPVNQGIPTPRVGFWDRQADRMMGQFAYPQKSELTAPQTLRIFARCPEQALGNYAFMGHTFHFRPAILIQEAGEISLEHVTIHAQPGMGLVGHRSRNLRFKNLRIVPRAGSIMSTNTDATHFTSCSGTIDFEGCQFEGQGDDSTNIHNYYYTLYAADGANSYLLKVEDPTETHAQVLDHPDPGDQLELVERSSLQVVKVVTVRSVENNPNGWSSRVTLDQGLPTDLGAYKLINASRLPRVTIRGCQVRSHRARAFLIKTRHVLIENNTIENTTGTAIHIGAEGDWSEGPGSADVTIRYNRIIHCGYGEGTQNGAAGISVNVKAPGPLGPAVHRDLRIEGNQIVAQSARYGIFVSGASDVLIRDNEYSGVEQSVEVTNSARVRIEDGAAPIKAP